MKIGRPRSPVALAVSVLLLGVTAFGDFLSPARPDVIDLGQRYAPPSSIRFIDAQGVFHWRPFVYRLELTDPQTMHYRERTDRIYPLELFLAGYRYSIAGTFFTTRHLIGVPDAALFHPWGTDDMGRDVLARTLAGASSSLLVLAFGIAAYFTLGVSIGAVAGFAGGWVDAALMRVSELVLALPALYMVLALQTLLPQHMPFWKTALLTAATIASVTWPPLARGVHGLILQIRNAGYIEASRALGATGTYRFHRHMLPSLAPFALAQTAVAAPVFILGEVILSFLNVGFGDTGTSWGTMLRNLVTDPRGITDFWWNLAPLVFVFATLLCLNRLGRPWSRKLPAPLS